MTFVQNFNNVSFVEAVDTVAKSVNIDLNINLRNQTYSLSDDEKKYYKITEDASNFLNFSLTNTKKRI